MGTNTVAYENGRVKFTDLSVDLPGGDYSISFSVTHPNTSLPLTVNLTSPFSAVAKTVTYRLAMPYNDLKAGVPFRLGLRLVDAKTGVPVDPSVLTGQVMTGSLQFTSKNGAQLNGETKLNQKDGAMRDISLDLTVDKPGHHYRIWGHLAIRPVGWVLKVVSRAFSVYPDMPAGTISKNFMVKVRGNKKKIQRSMVTFKLNVVAALEKYVSKDVVFWTVTRIVAQRGILSLNVLGSRKDINAAEGTLCSKIYNKNFIVRMGRKKVKFFSMKKEGQRRPKKTCKRKKR